MNFTIYRALQKIHLGGMEPPEDIEKGEKVLFDGETLKRADGKAIGIRSPSSLMSAINLGWIVPDGSPERNFRPKPAGVEVSEAAAVREKRKHVGAMVIQDEERDLGTIKGVRPANAPDPRKVADVSKTASMKVLRAAEDEGRVIGRMKTPTTFDKVEIGKDDRKVVENIDKSGPVRIREEAQKALVGDDLSDIFPDATSSEKPAPGIYKESSEKKYKLQREDESEEFESTPVSKKPAQDAETALGEWVKSGSINGLSPDRNQLVKLVDIVLRKNSALKAELSTLREGRVSSDKPSVERKPAEASMGNPNWDTTLHWKTRVVQASKLEDPKLLERIFQMEIPVVQKAIQARLEALRA